MQNKHIKPYRLSLLSCSAFETVISSYRHVTTSFIDDGKLQSSTGLPSRIPSQHSQQNCGAALAFYGQKTTGSKVITLSKVNYGAALGFY